ncbi:cytochrome P460 family protein [Sulfurovum sp.]|uniref:cytochrome P460 family protein n=1 Tax=Sulfurovum sp. TaxID=1969726 RepID=UPI0035645321
MSYPDGWQNWSSIAVSHRTDNNTLRVILGNDIAVKAARSAQTNPWPDGTVLAKVVWKDTQLENWKAATAPGDFVHAEFMFKDSKKYAKTYGWGWARWVGVEQKPFNDGAQICIACHTPVKNRDWVFTDPAAFPILK